MSSINNGLPQSKQLTTILPLLHFKLESTKAFDKIIAINNVMYWENQPEALLKLKQTLKHGGFIAHVLQRGEDQLKFGGCNDEIGFYIQCLSYAGFTNINVCIQPVLKPEKKYSKATRKMGWAWR